MALSTQDWLSTINNTWACVLKMLSHTTKMSLFKLQPTYLPSTLSSIHSSVQSLSIVTLDQNTLGSKACQNTTSCTLIPLENQIQSIPSPKKLRVKQFFILSKSGFIHDSDMKLLHSVHPLIAHLDSSRRQLENFNFTWLRQKTLSGLHNSALKRKKHKQCWLVS
mmetsp:Transcript_3498/g.6093  ORF Transcript_3498/g.6093 Transcript_3498/m.6093 type:complete len:165 (+) Transcript_3498:443-937(+)